MEMFALNVFFLNWHHITSYLSLIKCLWLYRNLLVKSYSKPLGLFHLRSSEGRGMKILLAPSDIFIFLNPPPNTIYVFCSEHNATFYFWFPALPVMFYPIGPDGPVFQGYAKFNIMVWMSEVQDQSSKVPFCEDCTSYSWLYIRLPILTHVRCLRWVSQKVHINIPQS